MQKNWRGACKTGKKFKQPGVVSRRVKWKHDLKEAYHEKLQDKGNVYNTVFGSEMGKFKSTRGVDEILPACHQNQIIFKNLFACCPNEFTNAYYLYENQSGTWSMRFYVFS